MKHTFDGFRQPRMSSIDAHDHRQRRRGGVDYLGDTQWEKLRCAISVCSIEAFMLIGTSIQRRSSYFSMLRH